MLLNWLVTNETKRLLVHYENKITQLRKEKKRKEKKRKEKPVHILEKELFQQVVVTEYQQVEGCVK